MLLKESKPVEGVACDGSRSRSKIIIRNYDSKFNTFCGESSLLTSTVVLAHKTQRRKAAVKEIEFILAPKEMDDV